MAATSIEWTDAVWNPVSGCTRVSPGCDNCYAARMTYRLEMMGQKKYAGLTVLNPRGDRHFNGIVRTDDDALGLPLQWKKPRRVFVNSMSDLFHRDVPFDFVDKVFATMAVCPRHTFQILTKRPQRMSEYFQQTITSGGCVSFKRILNEFELGDSLIDELHRFRPWPLPNVWLGTSVEDQAAANERIPHLLKCPASVRFLSVEPLLGSLDLNPWLIADMRPQGGVARLNQIHWVIVGGESGPGARPMHPQWARDIRDQCVSAGVPFFFKQWGEWGTQSINMATGLPAFREFKDFQQWVNKASTWVNGGACVDMKGRILKCGTDFQRADRETAFPVAILHRVVKKAAGRMLDGRYWDEMPTPSGGEVAP